MATREEIAAIFTRIIERFSPEKAADINATIQFELSGDGGGSYWLKIADGTIETGEGAVENPRMTVRAADDDFVSMVTGGIAPMQAFMLGKIKIQGDTNLAMKLIPLLG